MRGQPILDLGVGLGRTTGPLRALGGAYVGIDVSAEMAAACRARHPAADIRRLDARDLSVFANGRFRLAVSAFNGIDYVGHADRLRILAELRRVLAPAGWLSFAARNRAVCCRAGPGIPCCCARLAIRRSSCGVRRAGWWGSGGICGGVGASKRIVTTPS